MAKPSDSGVPYQTFTVEAFLIDVDGKRPQFASERFSSDVKARGWIADNVAHRKTLTGENRLAVYKIRTWNLVDEQILPKSLAAEIAGQ